MHFKDCPDPQQSSMISPENKDKVMHAALKIGDSTVFASDGRCTGSANFQGFTLALNAKDEAEAKRLFGALADGGEVQMPLAKTFFSPSFGTLADRFGVGWMVIVPQQ
jgi:PhnB protein